MKNYILVIIAVFYGWNCASQDYCETIQAYYKVRGINMNLPFDFVVDTRGMDSSRHHIIRSIRVLNELSNSYLVYPLDSNVYKDLCERQNFSIKQMDSTLYFLFEIQKITNSTEISRDSTLGRFVYFSFSDDIKQLVYCTDTNYIKNVYWKKYIQNGQKLDSHWYVVNRK